MLYIIQIFFAIPLGAMIENRGSSFAIMIGTLCNLLGILIKLLINESFWFAVVG